MPYPFQNFVNSAKKAVKNSFHSALGKANPPTTTGSPRSLTPEQGVQMECKKARGESTIHRVRDIAKKTFSVAKPFSRAELREKMHCPFPAEEGKDEAGNGTGATEYDKKPEWDDALVRSVFPDESFHFLLPFLTENKQRARDVRTLIGHSFRQSKHWLGLGRVCLDTEPPRPPRPGNHPEGQDPSRLQNWDYQKGSDGAVSKVVDKCFQIMENILKPGEDGKSAPPVEITIGPNEVTLLFVVPVEIPLQRQEDKQEGDDWHDGNLASSRRVDAMKKRLKRGELKLIFFAIGVTPPAYIKEMVLQDGRYVTISDDSDNSERFQDVIETILTEEFATGARLKTVFVADRLSKVHSANITLLLKKGGDLRSPSGSLASSSSVIEVTE